MKNVQTTLYGALRNAAQADPSHAALLYMGRHISYAKVLEEIELMARAFVRIGIGRDRVVTVVMPNVPESVYALYAASKLGAVAHLVHPLVSPSQLEGYLLGVGSGLAVLLAAHYPQHSEMLKAHNIPALTVSPAESLGAFKYRAYRLLHPEERVSAGALCTPWHGLRRELKKSRETLPDTSRERVREAEDCKRTAVYLHSGGTGGTPKTIEISSFAINSLSENASYILEREDLSNLYMHAVLPMFHGFGLCMGIHALLAHGGCDTLMPKFNASETVRLIEKGRIKCLIGVPALYEKLLAHRDFCGEKLKNICAAFVGGDFVPRNLLERFDERMKQAGAKARLFEGYGLTEVVTVCAVNTFAHNCAGTVGKPLPDIRMKIADESGAELPRGTAGELYVAGAERMTCYYRDPEGTAAAFAEDGEGTVWVRTGDFASMDEEGYVKFLSRIKRIVKVSGIGVFPSEIEQIAVGFPEIEAACALGVPDENLGSVIALFVQTKSAEQARLETELKRAVKEKLSVYSTPRSVYCLEEMPRTAVGKVDTRALEAIACGGSGE